MPMYVMRIKDKEPIIYECCIVVSALLTASQMVCRGKDLQFYKVWYVCIQETYGKIIKITQCPCPNKKWMWLFVDIQ